MESSLALRVLYGAAGEGGGWVHEQQLYDDLSYDEEGWTYDMNQITITLEQLRTAEFVEQGVDSPSFWRLLPCVYASLDEWCTRAIEALVERPGWCYFGYGLATLIEKIHRMSTIDESLCFLIQEHLTFKYAAAVEVCDNQAVRIRLSEWLKRCQTQALST